MEKTNSNEKIEIIMDEPLEDVKLDEFGHKHYVKIIKNIIDNYSQLNIGLFGRWGTGKTTIIDLLKKEIDNNRYETVMFPCWKYSNEPISLRRKFLLEVAEQIGESTDELREAFYIKSNRQVKDLSMFQSEKNLKQSLERILKSLSLSLGLVLIFELIFFAITCHFAGISLYQSTQLFFTTFIIAIFCYSVDILRKFTTNVTITKSDENLESLEQFEKAFKKLIGKVENKKKKTIIFVDDLDRCQGKKVIEILETIKTFMNVKNCVFVVACDDIIIRKTLIKENISDKNYMDKIFQVNIEIPPFRHEKMKDYAMSLLTKLRVEIPYDKISEVIDILIYKTIKNPRKVKILLNNYILSYEVLKTRINEGKDISNNFDIDYRLLAKITVIQTEYPEIFYDLEKNNKLLDYIDKVRCSEKELSEYQKKLLCKYFKINNENNTFEVKDDYKEAIDYLNYTSIISVSPEKIKSYIYLSQDVINAYYSDEYVENLESKLISRNTNGFIELFEQTKENDKIQIFRSLLQRIDRYENLELVNTLYVLTNPSLINIIPEDIKFEFASTVLNKIQENENECKTFEVTGIISYIEIVKQYDKYSSIVDKYVSMLNLGNLSYSVDIIHNICSSVNLIFDIRPLDDFLSSLFNSDFKEVLKLINYFIEKQEILSKYFTGKLFTLIMDCKKGYSDEDKEIIAQYLLKVKNDILIKSPSLLIEKILPYINENHKDLSYSCIEILNDMIDKRVNLEQQIDNIIDSLCEVINKWDEDSTCNLLFIMVLKLESKYQIKDELKTKVVSTLCSYYNQGKEPFAKHYINNITQIVKEYGNINEIVNNINSIISSTGYANRSVSISEYLNNVQKYLTMQNKNSIMQNIIKILSTPNYQVNENLVKASYKILSNCTFIINPEMINQLANTLINITNFQNRNPYPVNDEIVKLTFNEYSELISLFSNNNLRNQYFNSLLLKINANGSLSNYSIDEFIKHYTLLEDQPIRSSIIKGIISRGYNDNPSIIINIITYYGRPTINELFEQILQYINNKFNMTEKINNINKIINKLDYENRDVEVRILSTLFSTFEESVQNNIFDNLFMNIKVRNIVLNLFADKILDNKYAYALTVLSQKIDSEEERKEYYSSIEKKVKNSIAEDEIKRLLNLYMFMKDRSKYLEINDVNSIINNLLLYLLEGSQAQKHAAIYFIFLYYNEHKLPKGMAEKTAILLERIISNDESLRKDAINAASNLIMLNNNSKDMNELNDIINKYIETKTETERK